MRALDQMLDRAHERKVSLIGVSFGGLIAACYAARRPERVTSLILVSTPAPIWRPRPGDEFCVRFPRLALSLLRRCARSAGWGRRSIARANPGRSALRLGLDYARRAMQAPFSPAPMPRSGCASGRRSTSRDDCRAHHRADARRHRRVRTRPRGAGRAIAANTCKLIPGATHDVLPGTGHIGVITKPHRFAEIAGQFIYAANSAERNSRPQDETRRRRARHAS